MHKVFCGHFQAAHVLRQLLTVCAGDDSSMSVGQSNEGRREQCYQKLSHPTLLFASGADNAGGLRVTRCVDPETEILCTTCCYRTV